MLTTTEMADLLRVTPARITYAAKRGNIPEPVWVRGVRYFYEEDVAAIRTYFSTLSGKRGRPPKHRRFLDVRDAVQAVQGQ